MSLEEIYSFNGKHICYKNGKKVKCRSVKRRRIKIKKQPKTIKNKQIMYCTKNGKRVKCGYSLFFDK